MNAPRACWTVLAQKAQDQVSLVQAEMAQGRARLLSLQTSRERLQKLYEDYQKPAVGSDASGGMQETMNQRQFSSQLLTLMERVQQDLAQTEAALKVSLSAEAGRTYRLQRRNEAGSAWVNEVEPQATTVAGPVTFSLFLDPNSASVGLFRVEVQ